jgi:hypothetical protein
LHARDSSEIENERVFSIAGLIIGLRRQRMSPEVLDLIVNIYKNWPDDPTVGLSSPYIAKAGG